MKPIKSIAFAVSFMLALPVLAEAQVANEIELTRSVIQAEKKAAVMQAMQLDEPTSKKFWPLYNDYQESLRSVRDRRVQLIQDYSEVFKDVPEKKAKVFLDEMTSIEEARLKLKKAHIKRFRKSLSNKVVTKYFQTENKLESIVNFGLAQQIPLMN